MWLLLLIPACAAAVLSCLRLVRVASTADALAGAVFGHVHEPAGIGLYETAYLAGGPQRVVDLALVLMAGRGRLHLAHTGWTTVVDPHGRSRLERALIAETGPGGQCRTAELRLALTAHPTVLEIGERLALAGLAVPALLRERMALAVRHVQGALLLSAGLLIASLAMMPQGHSSAGTAIAWFALPVVLTAGTLLMARVDVQPYTRWAAPAGEELLRCARLPGPAGAGDDAERDLLTAVAVVGPSAVPDARLRAALEHRP
jgi:uncharacterized protein (TIGR04222 family)